MSRYGAGSGVARRIDDDGVVSKGKGARNRANRANAAADAKVNEALAEYNRVVGESNRASRRRAPQQVRIPQELHDSHERVVRSGNAVRRSLASAKGAAIGTVAGTGVGLYAAHKLRQKQTVGKGVLRASVAPRLARRTALVGTGARRVVTGDAVNARRVIGKADDVAKFSFSAFKSGVSQGLGRTTKPFAISSTAAKPREIKSGLAGLKVGQAGKVASQNKALTAGLIGTGALGGAAVSKRRFDPEDRRRHQAGVATGLMAAGGVGALGNAVRLSNADTRAYRASRSVGNVDLEGLRPRMAAVAAKVGEKKDGSRLGPVTAERTAYAERDYRRATAAHEDLGRKLKAAGKGGTVRGRVIGGRAAGYGGAGLALLGGAGAMSRTRNQDRWD